MTIGQIRASYAYALLSLTLVVSLLSFVRDRGELLLNISLWLFLCTFLATIASERLGLIATIAIVALSPSLHHQANALAGTSFHAWAFPGVDSAVGFIGGFTFKRGFKGLNPVLERFPAGPMLMLHAWISVSSIAAISRNLWQSASYTSLRGIAYNAWLVRGISWHDDFYPLQDLFFYSVAFLLLFCVWETVIRRGRRLVDEMAATLLAATSGNALFAAWQKLTGRGWAAGDLSVEVNAFWPDLHSFGSLMAVAFVLSGGILLTRNASRPSKILVLIGMLASASGLLLSGSRSTLLILCAGLVVLAAWSAFRTRGWRRASIFLAALLSVAALHVLLLHGYRGVNYVTLISAIEAFDLQSMNSALSHRPEIWAAAVRMYLASPVFGLGQGSFYRLSAIPEFSKTQALTELGGSGVHNYFLQSVVELGPVGFLLALFIILPFCRLGTRNAGIVSSYALVGIAVGNLYAHSLLVREMLMLGAMFAGSYLSEAEALKPHSAIVPRPMSTRRMELAVVALVTFALADYASSFTRFPFTYGERCFTERGITEDGWTGGYARVQLPHQVALLTMMVLADRPDLSRSALNLDVVVVEGRKTVLHSENYRFATGQPTSRSIDVPVPTSLVDWRYLELRTSRCYVPLNLGITYDPRPLGVRVTEFHSYAADPKEGTQIR
jgi:O-antigen ligase